MNFRFFWLLAALLCSAFASYVLTPLIPIYLVESCEHGGLAWSKSDAFSLFGTVLSAIYLSPSLGGFLGDCVCGRWVLAVVGFSIFGGGLVALPSCCSYNAVFVALMAISCGIGFIKVSLNSLVGRLPLVVRQRGYEYAYIVSSTGFMAGGLCSNWLFDTFGISGNVVASLAFALASACCFGAYVGLKGADEGWEDHRATVPENQIQVSFFIAFVLLCVPFFVCSNQLITGMPVFLHQCVDRRIGDWSMPSLWFGIFGVVAMILLSPFLRRAWNRLGSANGNEPFKCAVGLSCMAVSFALAAWSAAFGGAASMVPLFLMIHMICQIGDFHVRPVLLAAATTYTPARYHTLCTAAVYGCIALGGKLAGLLASFVDGIGFSGVFGFTAILALLCAVIALAWSAQRGRSQPAVTVYGE